MWFTAAKILRSELDEDDHVFKRWMDMVKDFSDKMEVLKKLANATLKVGSSVHSHSTVATVPSKNSSA